MIKKGKNIAYGLWITSIIAIITCYVLYPDSFTPKACMEFLKSFKTEILLIYVLLTFIRGFFLIPSTIFVIAGAMLFPDQLFLVLIISIAGVLFSATALYFFSDALGFSKHLESKYPEQVEAWRGKLNKRGSTLLVMGWSFFPLVPTDVICYVAGIVKLPYRYMIFGVFVGELVLDVIYIFFGSSMTSPFLPT